MLVFCTGIAGCGEKDYLEQFEALCTERGKEVTVHALGKKILEIGRKDYPSLGKYDLMEFPESTVSAWRAAALEALIGEMRGSEGVHVLDAHASFWVKNGPEPAINTSYLNELNPDVYVQIIDYEPAIHERLHDTPDLPEERQLSLEEVIRWQETERYTNRLLADHHQKEFYMLAQQHPAETLYNIVFEPDRPKVYQSFPISNVESEEAMERVFDHVERLREHATVFDPIEIDVKDFDDDRIMGLLNNHTVKRDQQFIRQSDMVIVNFPEIVYSSGVEYEINYASSMGKPVWIIKPDDYVGPFTEYTCERDFSDSKDAIEALQDKFGG